ncbi:MAG: hypothetical protein LBR90_03325, partial [Elusimicrobiota bacterium]|nr:hypothetical protein [Elusimicrobiota bacterium]
MKRVVFAVLFLFLAAFSFAQQQPPDWLQKAKVVMSQEHTPPLTAQTAQNGSSSLTLAKPDKTAQRAEPPKPAPAAPQPAPVKETPAPQPKAQPVNDNPNNVDWVKSNTSNFDIRSERRRSGVMTPNLGMRFETAHQILKRNIPWMEGSKISVYVYQDRASFLRNERAVAANWSGAFYSPDDNRMVMYDEPGQNEDMMSHFTHELTHLFVDNFFNPPGASHPPMEPPIWLNEGLAVNMEDIANDEKGGVWTNDLIVINIFSEADARRLQAAAKNPNRPQIGREQARRIAQERNILTDKTVSFRDFGAFLSQKSYDEAVKNNNIDNWYLQAYAMVRFLFRPGNAKYPEKRMQFEQLTKMLNAFEPVKDAAGNNRRDAQGRALMRRYPAQQALRKAYGFRDIADFEQKFWKWLLEMQQQERAK